MSPKLILLAFLFLYAVSSQTTPQTITSLQDAQDLLAAIQKQKAELQQELSQFEANINNIRSVLVASIKEDIQWSGLGFGNRWRIEEEGSSSYQALVFRDMTYTNKGTDRRYAMYQDRYTDY